jgi:Transposase
VLDAFHVVKLAGQALDEVRRRVQQQTLHRRGHKDDPLYKVRRTLQTGDEHLTDRQRERLDKYLPIGDPNGEVEVTCSVYQQVRSIYHAESQSTGRKLAEKLLDTLHTCPIPEVKRLGKTLRRWREEILAYFATGGVSNGGTEAINGVIEKTRRLAHGFRNSPTTASGSCSPPTAHAPTDADHRSRPNHADLGRAALPGTSGSTSTVPSRSTRFPPRLLMSVRDAHPAKWLSSSPDAIRTRPARTSTYQHECADHGMSRS